MQALVDKRRSPAILIGLFAALGIWALGQTRILSGVDGLVYDSCLQLAPVPTTPPRVLLLEWESWNARSSSPSAPKAPSDIYERTVNELFALGARQIAFTFLPEDAPRSFFVEAARKGVVFGRPLMRDGRGLVELPAAAQGVELTCGVVMVPTTERGVARRRQTSMVVENTTYPLLEAVLAYQHNQQTMIPPEFGVRFRGGAGSLPHASLEALLAGQLVPELVQGQTVLVGRTADSPTPGVVTPTTPGGTALSLLEFQGQALDSLLRSQTIRTLSSWQTLVLLLGSTFLATILVQWLELKRAFWTGVVILLGEVVLCGIVFVTLDRWLPLVGLTLAQSFAFFLVIRDKAAQSQLGVRRLLVDLSTRLRDRPAPVSFEQPPENWGLVAFTTQGLNLNRQLFLETIPGTVRVREVAAFNCSFAEILERRRDYTRAPYNTALETRGPIKLQTRPFLDHGNEEEDLYLVPLLFADTVLGFWVLGVASNRAQEGFHALLGTYAAQIAELLYRRREYLAQQDTTPLLARMLTFTSREEECHALTRTVTLLESRLDRSERLFAESAQPTIVWDAFGRLRDVNAAMRARLRAWNLDADELGAAGVLVALTGMDLDYLQKVIRSVLQEKGRLSLPAIPSEDGKRYLLHLYPLRITEGQMASPTPFGVEGICCELQDRTALARLDDLREQLVERVGVILRNDIAAVELASSLLAAGDLSADERQQLDAVIHDKLDRMNTTLTEARSSFTDLPGESARLPVDATPIFQEALEIVRLQHTAQDIHFEIHQPPLLNFVFAAPEPLRRVFTSILMFLAKDTRSGCAVQIHVDQTAEWVRYACQNVGFGIPEDRFQQLLSVEKTTTSEDFRELRTALVRVRSWGGVVDASSKVGEGTSIQVCLPMFA
jgi:CHASE2 domain-containing sensor protein